MALPEGLIQNELPQIPNGIEAVPEMSNLHDILTTFGAAVAVDLISKYDSDSGQDFRIVIPLQGALVPTLYVLEHIRNDRPDVYDYLMHRLEFVTTTKEGEEAKAEVVLASEVETDDETTYFGIEDIVDDGGTIKALAKLYGGHAIELHAAFHKPGSVEKAEEKVKEIEPNTTIHAYHEIPDKWVFGAGMDGGSTRLNGSGVWANALLASYQRLSAHGYAYVGEEIPDYEALCSFLASDQIPIAQNIIDTLNAMEIAKMNDDSMNFKGFCIMLRNELRKSTTHIFTPQEPHQ